MIVIEDSNLEVSVFAVNMYSYYYQSMGFCKHNVVSTYTFFFLSPD